MVQYKWNFWYACLSACTKIWLFKSYSIFLFEYQINCTRSRAIFISQIWIGLCTLYFILFLFHFFLQITSPSSTTLRVRWEAPPSNQTHGRLLGYYLGIRERKWEQSVRSINITFLYTLAIILNQSMLNIYLFNLFRYLYSNSFFFSPKSAQIPYNFTTVGGADDASPQTLTVVTNLKPFTSYSIVLQAFNSRGAGPTSEPAVAITLQDSKFFSYSFTSKNRGNVLKLVIYRLWNITAVHTHTMALASIKLLFSVFCRTGFTVGS